MKSVLIFFKSGINAIHTINHESEIKEISEEYDLEIEGYTIL